MHVIPSHPHPPSTPKQGTSASHVEYGPLLRQDRYPNLTFVVIMVEVGEVSKVVIHGLQMNQFLPACFCTQSPFQYDSQSGWGQKKGCNDLFPSSLFAGELKGGKNRWTELVGNIGQKQSCV